MDFGHAFYMRQVVTNASKEGVRYGVAQQNYTTSLRKPPSAFSPTISNYITGASYLNIGASLPSDANVTVTPSGAGYTSGLSGDPLTVTVTATKTWWLLGTVLGHSSTAITAVTTMRLE